MHDYDYDDCPLLEGQVRLLYLKPSANRTDDIVVELQSCTIDKLIHHPNHYPFTALSYNWGDAEESDVVFVGTRANDEPAAPRANLNEIRTLKVKPNLSEFLREYRDSQKLVTLWVDYFCVNQKDSQEKTDQVSKMGMVYSTAAEVSVWLGPADDDGKTDRAMDFIKFILKDQTGRFFKARYARAWSELVFLIRRRYFTRRWAVQEVALAKNAEVRCGSKRLRWRDFSEAVNIFTRNFDTISNIIKGEPGLEKSLEGVTSMQPLGVQTLIDVLSKPQGLERLVLSLSSFGVADPRDGIYALLNMAKEKPKPQHKPRKYASPNSDYTINLLKAYTKFVQWCVQESGSLDILCRHWALPEIERKVNECYPDFVELPSWIKTITDSASSTREGFGGRRTGDSLVGTPESRWYDSSQGMEPTISYGMDGEVSKGNQKHTEVVSLWQRLSMKLRSYLVKTPQLDWSSSITVRGKCIGRIAERTLMPDGIIPQEVLQSLGYNKGSTDLEPVPDTLWRTLIADRGLDGKTPSALHCKACMLCLKDDTDLGYIDTNDILQHDKVGLKAHYMKRVQAVCWNRAFIDCGQDENGDRLVGVGPHDSQAGDLICILYGLSVPCILRPSKRGVGRTPQCYELVGEAFILGKMDGEAVFGLSEEELRGQDFRII